MEAIVDILEQELEEAFEVKNKKSLHRYVVLLTENIVGKDSYNTDIRDLTEIVKRGFDRMDERFEAVDRRFEAMQTQMDRRFEAVDKRFELMQNSMDKQFAQVDKRFEEMGKKFNMMFTFMNLGMGIIILVTILIKFIV